MSLIAAGIGAQIGGHTILSNVDFEVRRGELVALVGPNGAGKTTLLNVLSGDLAPSTGAVTLDGTPVGHLPAADLARRRSVLPQDQRLAFGFRVVEVVRMGRTPWARRPEEDLDDLVVTDSLQRADVMHLADRAFPTLSGGEKARASFARVLAQSTPVVLLDEPTAALDIRHTEQVLSEARRLADAGHAVVAVLHDLTTAAAHADRICLMAGGRVRADGPPEQVLDPAILAEVYGHPVDVLHHHDRLVVVPHRLTSRPSTTNHQEGPCAPVS